MPPGNARHTTGIASSTQDDGPPPARRAAPPAANGQRGRAASGGVAMTRRTSLQLPPGLALSEWRHLGRQMFVITDSSAWWLGDWLIYGQSHFPDRYKRAVAET